MKNHETLLKHCEILLSTRHSMRQYRRSMRRYRCLRGVSGDCGVGITLQMCNRVTNHGDMGTFSRPAAKVENILLGPRRLGHTGIHLSLTDK